jgi:flagellar hook-basal body complex protein FliE
MDGLTVSTGQKLLNTGRTTSEIRNDDINRETTGADDVGSFAETLKNAVGKVNEMSIEANQEIQKLATGQTRNVPEVMIAAEKASIAFKLMTQVRNKIIDAYQEVMKMQV